MGRAVYAMGKQQSLANEGKRKAKSLVDSQAK